MATGFKINGVDWDDKFVRRDIFTQGGLWAWGPNYYGTLGNNASGTGTDRSSPIQTIAGGINWRQVSVGASHTGGIKTDGTLWMWGNGLNGKLGTNDIANRLSPIQTVSATTNWKQVSCSGYQTNNWGDTGCFTAAIKTDGTLWMWGHNTVGQLGTNDIIHRSSPIQTVSGGTNWKFVSTGGAFSGAIKMDGTLWTWGSNFTGQLGINSTIDSSSPAQTVTGGNNWKQVSCNEQNISAIKTDNTLWIWGLNTNGQLGTNDTIHRSSPIQTVSAGTNWRFVSSGRYHTAAIKTDGTLWLWGSGGNGELGNNSATARSSPVQTISGGSNWKSVSTGGYRTAAIKTDGTLWLWGSNFSGEAGTNINGNNYSSPVQTITQGTNWKQISLGIFGVSGIREDYY